MPCIASARLLPACLAVAATALAAAPVHAANGLTVLHAFDYEDGNIAYGRLVQGDDGAFYGTTYLGGANNMGEVFKVDAGGNFAIVHSFSGTDGASPISGLVLMDDGNFYGTAPSANYCPTGGACRFSDDVVFRMAPDGSLTTLHSVPASAGERPGSLIAGRDGLLYGLTAHGGAARKGSAYAIATDGTYVHLADFVGANGSTPYGGLTEGTDGNFYGTTSMGGTDDKGTVFRMTPGGTITTLHSFHGGKEGWGPGGTLLQGNDSRFYGGTPYDGGGRGTAFAITADGELTTLHAFNGGDGTGPMDALVQGSDGDLYGVGLGGYYNQGTLFRLSTGGTLTTLHQFEAKDGKLPYSAPVFGSDGRLYGTTTMLGSRSGLGTGSVYAFDLSAPRKPEIFLLKSCYDLRHNGIDCLHQRRPYRVLLNWTATNVQYCRASGAWTGPRPTGGNQTLTLIHAGAFLYRLDCVGPDGHASAQTFATLIR